MAINKRKLQKTVDDGSKIARLMDIFTDISQYDFKQFPKTSARKQQFKSSQKGRPGVSYLVEQFAKECAEETKAIDVSEHVESCAKSFGVPIEKACTALGLTLADYENAKQKLAEIAAEEAEAEKEEK